VTDRPGKSTLKDGVKKNKTEENPGKTVKL
jgi:hypothetical protein